MVNKKKPTNKKALQQADAKSYSAVGMAFFTVGMAMMVSESTRAVGIPFFVLGCTFLAISYRDDKDKPATPKK